MLLSIPVLVIFTSLLLYSKELISTNLPGYLQFMRRIRLFQLVSLVIHWLLTALLLGLLPHERVRLSYTIIASVVTGSCWYFLRLGLNMYVRWFPQLPLLYGSLAFIPVFLLWIFLSWLVILFGVELNYTMHYSN
jgi:YihY family inner membrane protein